MIRETLTISALIAAVLLVRAVFKNRVPKRMIYALWLVVLLKLRHFGVQIIRHRAWLCHAEHLGDVDDRAAADRYNAAKAAPGELVEDGVHHGIGRLAAAEFLLKQRLAAKPERFDDRGIDVFIR